MLNKTKNTPPQRIKTATKNAEKQNAFDVIILCCVVVKGNCQTIAKNRARVRKVRVCRCELKPFSKNGNTLLAKPQSNFACRATLAT